MFIIFMEFNDQTAISSPAQKLISKFTRECKSMLSGGQTEREVGLTTTAQQKQKIQGD